MKHSVNIGPPDIRVNGSRREANKASNDKKHLKKQQRHATARAAGMAKAAGGDYKKGRGKKSAELTRTHKKNK